MKVLIFNYDTNETIAELEMKTIDSIFDLRLPLSELQQKEDILKLGYLASISDLGIREFSSTGCIMSNLDKYRGEWTQTGKNSMVIGKIPEKIKEPEPIVVWKDKEKISTTLRLGIICWREGYVLATGKKSAGLFSAGEKVYLRKITSANIHSAQISTHQTLGAKIFKSYAEMLKYVEQHKSTFEFCVKQHGYQWDIEKSCDLFDEFMNLSGKRLEKEQNAKETLVEMLNNINMIDVEEDEVDTTCTPKEEAIYRLKKLNLWDRVITAFNKENKLFFSEFNGIVYDLNDDARKAIDNVKENGGLPYHVIKTGDMYAVLYVSPNPEEWAMERPTVDGNVFAYVYNANENIFSEYGSIQIMPCNGGLKRTA